MPREAADCGRLAAIASGRPAVVSRAVVGTRTLSQATPPTPSASRGGARAVDHERDGIVHADRLELDLRMGASEDAEDLVAEPLAHDLHAREVERHVLESRQSRDETLRLGARYECPAESGQLDRRAG